MAAAAARCVHGAWESPATFLHVCDRSQGLVCDYSTGTGATCNFEDVEEGCEVNGRVYRDGEVFQPSCKLQCRCLDGGFTCVPLCQEDVRLPTPDCPHPAARGHSGQVLPRVGLRGWRAAPGCQGSPRGSIPGGAVPVPAVGHRSGAPAQPPVAWASPPVSPTRTVSAAWRHRGGSAWPDPARPCQWHPL
uniref:Cellular communication network factor 5 n=1 Tax=Anas platyrhynchos TaxID=8839 RepID=A0A8B9T2B1_ANAPL